MRMASWCAFLLVLTGLLGAYSEFVWPGRVLPGLAGCVLTIVGAYFLWQNSLTAVGLTLVGAAILFFVAEAFWRVNLIAGLFGITALSCGFWLLIDGPRRIPPALAVPSSVAFGGITVFLLHAAKRARSNKWSDIHCASETSRK